MRKEYYKVQNWDAIVNTSYAPIVTTKSHHPWMDCICFDKVSLLQEVTAAIFLLSSLL